MVQAMLAEFEEVAICDAVIERAKVVQRTLAADGLRGRKVPDLLIAAAAELHGLAVIHYDRDFEIIAGITGQVHDWVVPPGSID